MRDAEPDESEQEQFSRNFSALKKEIELSKAHSRKIKSLVDTDNVVEEMSRLFYILKDNLKEICEGQLRLREQIDRIEETDKIKLSFIKEVSEMLNKSYSSLAPNPQNNDEPSKVSTPLF